MKGGIEIAKGLGDNAGLKVLRLAWNGLGEDGAKAMAVALEGSTLAELDLTSNRIYAEGFLHLVKALKKNDDLKWLKVCIPKWI